MLRVICSLLIFFSFSVAHLTCFAATNWLVDKKTSRLTFDGKRGETTFSGEFKSFTPEIFFDANDLASSHIKVKIDTNSAIIENKDFDGSLRTADWLNTKSFPEAIFESQSIQSIGADKTGIENFVAKGNLTILGIKKDIFLPFSLKNGGLGQRGFGEIIIKRLDFGIGQSTDAKASIISDDITIKFDIVASPVSAKE